MGLRKLVTVKARLHRLLAPGHPAATPDPATPSGGNGQGGQGHREPPADVGRHSALEVARPAPRPLQPPATRARELPLVAFQPSFRPGDGEVLVDVPTREVDAMLDALRATGWSAEDTGRTVTTEDGEDDLTTLRIGLPTEVGLAEPPEPEPEPAVRGAVYARGDLILGADLEVEGPIVAEGSVRIGRGTTVLGTVTATGDVTMGEASVAGDVFAGGQVRMAPSARCNAIVARRGSVLTPPEPEPAQDGGL